MYGQNKEDQPKPHQYRYPCTRPCWKVTVLGQLSRQATWRSQLEICLSYQCRRSVEDHDSVAVVCLANLLVLTSSTVASSAPRLTAPYLCSPISQPPSIFQRSLKHQHQHRETINHRTDDLHFQKLLSRLLRTMKTWIQQRD